jgi:superfamily II DNA helicase RecQ
VNEWGQLPASVNLFTYYNGVPYTDDQIRHSIEKKLTSALNQSINVSTYRQIAAMIGEVHLNISGDAVSTMLDSVEDEIVDFQMGHNALTAQISYGRSLNALPIINRRSAHKFFLLSNKWREVVGITRGNLRHNLEKNSNDSKVTSTENYITILSNTPIQQPKTPSKESLQLSRYPDQLLNSLRAITGNSSARWSSTVQRQAAQMLISDQDCMLVMPTGFGKTLLVEVLGHATEFGWSIYCPLFVALKTEFRERVLKLKISCYNLVEFESGVVPESGIILASPEEILTEKWESIIGHWVQKRNVHRIIFDEAHELIFSTAYRPVLSRAGNLAISGIPVKLLSATIPNRILKAFDYIFSTKFYSLRCEPEHFWVRYLLYHVECSNSNHCNTNCEKYLARSITSDKENLIKSHLSIIYCSTISLLHLVEKEIRCFYFYSGARV